MTQIASSPSLPPEPQSHVHDPGQHYSTSGTDAISQITEYKDQQPATVNGDEHIHSSDDDEACNAMDTDPFFPVTGNVTFRSVVATVPQQGVELLPPALARLISLASLGAVLLLPLSGCGSTGDSGLPCPVPTSTDSGTPVPTHIPASDASRTPLPTPRPIACRTSSGSHYVWFPSRGGWVRSNDGVHPNANERGVGAGEEHTGSSKGSSGEGEGHSGVGNGHGSGHGGGEGG